MPHGLFDALIPEGTVPDAVRDDYLDRIRDHPAASFTEPIQLTDASGLIPRVFVRCITGQYTDEFGGDPVAIATAHAREHGWTYREIRVPHGPTVTVALSRRDRRVRAQHGTRVLPRAAPSSTGPLLDVIADRRASALERSRCRRPPPDAGAHRPAGGPRKGEERKAPERSAAPAPDTPPRRPRQRFPAALACRCSTSTWPGRQAVPGIE
jgi:hypothetical protein